MGAQFILDYLYSGGGRRVTIDRRGLITLLSVNVTMPFADSWGKSVGYQFNCLFLRDYFVSELKIGGLENREENPRILPSLGHLRRTDSGEKRGYIFEISNEMLRVLSESGFAEDS